MTCLILEAVQSLDEKDLLEQLRLNYSDAFEFIVREYGPRMLATARRLLACEHDANDAVQEAFISAFNAIESFNGEAKLSTWLHRIVVNACLMKQRSKARRTTVSIEDHLPTFDETGHHCTQQSGWGDEAFAAVSTREMQAIVRAQIDQLPESYRQVVLLRDIEGLDTNETAALLGESVGNIKTRLHRARQALRSLLEQHIGQI
jgi:RNA polymerase sigma-70 factor (ECF subfamily)